MNGIYHASNPEHLFLRAHQDNDRQIVEAVLKTLDGLSHMLDPARGSIYVASFGEWNNIIPEKRTGNQAIALFESSRKYYGVYG